MIKPSRTRTTTLAALLITFTSFTHAQDSDGFRPLFNGKDLSGWVPVSVDETTFTVADGMLICSGKPIGELRTDRMYQNFVLELEWRHMKPRGNAGVFIWADDIPARGQPFHRSIEVQVLENDYGHRPGSFTTHGDIFPIHGSRMRPLTGANVGKESARAFPTEHRSNPSPQWNHYRIECNDGAISLAVNGKVVTKGDNASPRKGYICLESEGGVVHYRNIRIKELPDTPVEDADVAIKDRGYRCLYRGVDLDEWTMADRARPLWKPSDWVLKHSDEKINGDSSITTKEKFKGNVGLMFDVRLPEKTSKLYLQLPGTDSVNMRIMPEDLLGVANTQGFVRYTAELRDGKVTLWQNDKQVATDEPIQTNAKGGPLRFMPEGLVDLANIFVRDLNSK